MSIQVLVVDDSAVARGIISKFLNSDPDIDVVGTAKDGREAIDVATQLKPDLITMDINMPVMDGLATTEHIMAYQPTPILVVSSLVKSEVDLAFRAMSLGALDAMEKPGFDQFSAKDAGELVRKVKLLSQVPVVTHLEGKRRTRSTEPSTAQDYVSSSVKAEFQVVAIGSSTGGPKALYKVLSELPADFPCGIAVVQHISEGFTSGLVEWLDRTSNVKVKEAEESDKIQPGVVLIAPHDFHMMIVSGGRIRLNKALPIKGHRPSATILFSSVAKVYNANSIGVILTGMGEDGATGLAEMRENGSKTIAQDEATSVIFGMPKVAIEMGAAEEILPIDEIGQFLNRTVMDS
ncbi:TPA: chemotaxis response regulator protein-glutamate methylesterase [Candidatus Poribacteria bacterium]|nr:chemotaxis response regulator protein-glutamate methylesterase [Candidatus Poribacteria bacterium]